MAAYMIIPVLVTMGLCIFFYLLGIYTFKLKSRATYSKPAENTALEDEKKKLEEENARIKEELRAKEEALEAHNKTIETVLNEQKELFAKEREANAKKADSQREEVINIIRLKKRISQLEAELAKKNSASGKKKK